MNVSRTKLVGVALVIFTVTVGVFWPSVHGEFLAGDDVVYLRQSARLDGLTWNAVTWAFTTTVDYYHPLPRLSHVLDYQIFGENPAGHHATSVAVHALNAALLFGFLWTLLGATSLTTGERLMVALWVAVVFAIHPLQVESVAWISGRTQLLCATFGIICLWAYVWGARWWTVLGLFVAALLCKPMAVSLPFVMLAMDYYPLRRYERFGWGRLLWEKSLLITLAAAVGLAAKFTMARDHGPRSLSEALTLLQRVLLMFESLAICLLRLVWPAHFSPDSPPSGGLSLDQWPVWVSMLSVVMITVTVVVEKRRSQIPVAAWGAYLVLLLPVSGLLRGSQPLAQRHAYVAMVPLLLLGGGAVVWVWRHSTTTAHLALIGLLAGQLGFFAVRTHGLIPDWHNRETYWRAALREFPDSYTDYEGLASTVFEEGRVGEALEYAQRAVEIAPEQYYLRMTLARVLARLGRVQEALAQDEQAMRMDPDPARAHYNFAVALMELGKVPEAARSFEQALQIKPEIPLAHDGLGSALYQMGRVPEAIKEFEAELRINPNYANAHNNLGNALQGQGRVSEAIEQYEQAVRLKPDNAEAHESLATAMAQTGKIEEAIAHYEQALRIKPDYAEAHNNLGNVLLQEGKIGDAVGQYEQALRSKPDYTDAHYNLGNALMGQGRRPEAIEQYEQALKLRPDFAPARNALARLGSGQ